MVIDNVVLLVDEESRLGVSRVAVISPVVE
jgi:hypothetical protein